LFLRYNQSLCHPLLDFDNGMDMYSDDRLPRRWMLAHSIDTARSDFFLSFFFYSLTAKKYFHSLKWVLIPRHPSHNTMKAKMC